MKQLEAGDAKPEVKWEWGGVGVILKKIEEGATCTMKQEEVGMSLLDQTGKVASAAEEGGGMTS